MVQSRGKNPKTIDEAVNRLMSELSLREKTEIARTAEEDLHLLSHSLGLYVRSELTRWSTNRKLVREATAKLSRKPLPYQDVVSFVISLELWRRLQKVHVLRLVK